MNKGQTIQRFVELLDQQASLIGELAEREGELQELVGRRDWPALESLLPRMTRISEAVAAVEEQRNDLFLAISAALGGEASFGVVLSRLPQDLRVQVSTAYRRLKVAVLALQSRTAGMDSYIRSTVSTTRGILQELYPEHTARGYSRDGQNRFNAAPAVMVDRGV